MRKAWILPVFLLLASCGGKDPFDKTSDFDQSPFLENTGNIILEAYAGLETSASGLYSEVEFFVAAPDASSLQNVRERLKAARLSWQKCTPYQFGPGLSTGLTAALNIYPVNDNRIELNISSGTYDLGALANVAAKGFPAIEYLLYGDGKTDEEIIASFSEANRKQYLLDVAALIETKSAQVHEAWQSGYLDEFTVESALGVDVGSSVGKLVNAMSQDFERNTRDGKLGIPVGIRSLGVPVPENCEAYYAGYSVELLEANIAAYGNLFLGGPEGIGFDDYLKAIGAATTGNEDLAEKIETQFETIRAAIDQISDPLPQSILDQKTDVERVFAEMQTLVVYFKTDMASSMGVIISYQDNDGD